MLTKITKGLGRKTLKTNMRGKNVSGSMCWKEVVLSRKKIPFRTSKHKVHDELFLLYLPLK